MDIDDDASGIQDVNVVPGNGGKQDDDIRLLFLWHREAATDDNAHSSVGYGNEQQQRELSFRWRWCQQQKATAASSELLLLQDDDDDDLSRFFCAMCLT